VKVFLRSVRRLLVTASVVLISPILVTLMKEALISSEPGVLTRATRRNIPGETILHVNAVFLHFLGDWERYTECIALFQDAGLGCAQREANTGPCTERARSRKPP
jgi:hypothetical protein